ncbi:DUF6270 domain-containing protein [Clostridium sp.]|uniref:DUF6270 domain-containing protein n=1 Tax=Clostridium sp. TaxID=1506 RepID=UPI0025BF05D1|nr:DUF6270 domain-containing protein [Clostridium sp.]
MKEIKVDIIGSCVTRDAFEFIKESNQMYKYKINNYISKVSIISLMSKKLESEYYIDNTRITKWESKQIQYDLKKDWFDKLKKSDSDVIIIDFIDERYNLYKVGECYLTKSNIIKNSAFKFKGDEKTYEIKRDLNLSIKLWEDSFDKFINELKKLNKPIIIHEAFWKNKYRYGKINKSVSKKIYFKNFLASIYYINFFKKGKFKASISKEVNKQNKILMRYYTKVNEYADLKHLIINIDYKADMGHKWGIAPFHYEKGYYLNFIYYLNEIMSEIMKDIK